MRARYRAGNGPAQPITPGQVYQYTIDLIATSQVFKAGHRLRVDVASSNFPCFDRNPGNGAPAATATEADFVVAEQADLPRRRAPVLHHAPGDPPARGAMRQLDGRVAVVTGAASGIGRALAARFAAEGMTLVLADIEEDPLRQRGGRSCGAAGRDGDRRQRTDVSSAADVPGARRRARSPSSAPCTCCATTRASAAAPTSRRPRSTPGSGSST